MITWDEYVHRVALVVGCWLGGSLAWSAALVWLAMRLWRWRSDA